MKFFAIHSFVFSVLLITAASAAFAESQSSPMESAPDLTPYEALKALYASGTVPATLGDFDRVGGILNWKCAGSNKSSPETAFNIGSLLRYELKTPGKPSHGPLFPGTPDLFETKLVDSGIAEQGKAELFAKQTQIENGKQDLIMTVSQVAGYQTDFFPIQFKLRRSGQFIAMYIVKGSVFEGFGYCWK